MPLTPATTDKVTKVGNPGTATTMSAPGYTTGVSTSINVGSTTNWPTDTKVIFAIDRAQVVNGVEERIAGTYNEFEGIVTGANTIANLVRRFGTAQNYVAGSLTRIYIPVAATRENDLVEGFGLQHKLNGEHGDITATSLDVNGNSTFDGNVTINGIVTVNGTEAAGWDTLSGTVTGVTDNGNRQFDLAVNTDHRNTLTPGMRLRTTRATIAPVQTTSLNGTNQYWVDSTVAGMAFTDDFVVGAWVKMTAYGTNMVISRMNGTSGWDLYIGSDGSVNFTGYNGGLGNNRAVYSIQTIPLNKWVHIAAQLDMSAYTASSTTCYIMIDGVEVPVGLRSGGTNPTALIQAGNLEVGSGRGGTLVFPGKISQAFVSSGKITPANVRIIKNQSLTPALIATHAVISAYAFDGNGNDLNTTNANNLTASGAAVATNADSPFGGQGNSTISSTLDYAIVQKVTAGVVSVLAAEGCTIATSGTIQTVSYAKDKNPFGFPGQQGKFDIESLYAASFTQGGANNGTWYNVGHNLILPIGEWELSYAGVFITTRAATGYLGASATLSIGAATNSDIRFKANTPLIQAATDQVEGTLARSNPVSTTANTPYYLNMTPNVSGSILYWQGGSGMIIIRARNAYA